MRPEGASQRDENAVTPLGKRASLTRGTYRGSFSEFTLILTGAIHAAGSGTTKDENCVIPP